MPIKKEEKIGIRKFWCEETNFETRLLNPKLCFRGTGQRGGGGRGWPAWWLSYKGLLCLDQAPPVAVLWLPCSLEPGDHTTSKDTQRKLLESLWVLPAGTVTR